MDKTYSPADIETRIYAQWESRGYFAPSGKGPKFSIVIPPPNVTGTLHMGHAFEDTIMRASMRCGSRAPTMRGLPRRWWSNVSSMPRGKAGSNWDAMPSWRASGSGRQLRGEGSRRQGGRGL